MRIISKVFMRIVAIVLVMVCVCMFVGMFKFGGVSNYLYMLNNKNWNVEKEYLSYSPASWLDLFFDDRSDGISLGTNLPVEAVDSVQLLVNGKVQTENVGNENEMGHLAADTGDLEVDDEKQDAEVLNPYDPDFEDEFNSYFLSE